MQDKIINVTNRSLENILNFNSVQYLYKYANVYFVKKFCHDNFVISDSKIKLWLINKSKREEYPKGK
jgi:hypothetical protein